MNGSSSSVIESRSIPEAIPPCGGAPIASASSRKPNFDRCSSGEMLQQAEDLRLQVGLVDPERAAGELDPVADEVVGDRLRRARVGVEQRLALRVRPRERMVDGVPALELGSHSNIGKSVTQRNRQRVAVDQLELAAEVKPQRAEHARDHRRLVGGEEHRVAGRRDRNRSSSASPRNFAIGERTSPSAP